MLEMEYSGFVGQHHAHWCSGDFRSQSVSRQVFSIDQARCRVAQLWMCSSIEQNPRYDTKCWYIFKNLKNNSAYQELKSQRCWSLSPCGGPGVRLFKTQKGDICNGCNGVSYGADDGTMVVIMAAMAMMMVAMLMVIPEMVTAMVAMTPTVPTVDMADGELVFQSSTTEVTTYTGWQQVNRVHLTTPNAARFLKSCHIHLNALPA